MKVIRIYSGDDGESHFDTIELSPGPLPGIISGAMMDTQGAFLRWLPAGDVQDWHPAPRRQYVVTLVGECEIEVASGVRRHFQPGDVLLAEDTTGRGHITRTIGDGERICMMIPLAE